MYVLHVSLYSISAQKAITKAKESEKFPTLCQAEISSCTDCFAYSENWSADSDCFDSAYSGSACSEDCYSAEFDCSSRSDYNSAYSAPFLRRHTNSANNSTRSTAHELLFAFGPRSITDFKDQRAEWCDSLESHHYYAPQVLRLYTEKNFHPFQLSIYLVSTAC